MSSNIKVKHAAKALGRERRYSSYSFTTSALDGGELSVSHPGYALPQGKGPPVQEAGWAPEPVWTQRLEEKSFAPAGIEPVARHYTAWATPAHCPQTYRMKNPWILHPFVLMFHFQNYSTGFTEIWCWVDSARSNLANIIPALIRL
jgi:hypothetical protein